MTNNVCILIVDDDPTNRLVLRALLKDSGYRTIEAENGEQAVAAVSDGGIDIILLDIMMPVMDGYEAARIIKSNYAKFIPIIFLTAMIDEDALVKCIDSGGDDFLTKPYNHVLLRAKIDSMLRIASLYRKVEAQNIELNRHNNRIQQEILVAKSVFANFLGGGVGNKYPGLRYSMSPMSIFNGDMILAEKNNSGGLDMMISDFTGHGLSAAIGSIPVSDIFSAMTRKGFSYSETLSEVNNKLKKMLPTQMFMAAAFVGIDRNNNIVTIANCGLPDLYLIRDGAIAYTFKSLNLPLGIVNQLPESFAIEMESLQYGDRIIAMTDGILEAQNTAGEFYGKKRMLESVNNTQLPDELFGNILNNCLNFSENMQQMDDITLLELCHNEHVEFTDKEENTRNLEPAQWSMRFSLDMQSLRNFDILPFIMQGVNGLQSIPNGRATIHTILTEIYTNAVDHGLLKLDSAMKSSPEGYLEYYQEKQSRLDEILDGNIQIEITHELKTNGGGKLIIYVTDSGDGFDYTRRNLAMSQNKGYSGRGMNLISRLCKEVKFLGKGNAIMAVYEWG
jgi:CheY-like chemotaxis protein/anti-sigma regulatory factor (Ser/Thr protein kinase)